MNYKVSVLSNGSILLDGTPVDLSNLKSALEQANRTTDGVLYYRENAGTPPPPTSKEVMNLVVANKLPISLSSRPDFSDYVDRFGQAHSRSQGSPLDRDQPLMPDVDLSANAGEAFAKARAQASGHNGTRGIAVVMPDRDVLVLTLPPPPPQTSIMAKQLASVIPSDRSRDIVVIGCTAFTMAQKDALPSLQEANRAIPFFGILCGLSYLGHNISVFEGHPSALASGLAQGEVLIVDSAMLPFLQPDWLQIAQKVMHADRRIFIHDRKSGRLMPGDGSEPDGEASYANCLLTTLGKGPAMSVEIVPGRPVPNLASLATDPEELEWVAKLPFRYGSLDALKVIDVLLTAAGRSKQNPPNQPLSRAWTLKTKLVAKGAEPKLVTFEMRIEGGKLVIDKR